MSGSINYHGFSSKQSAVTYAVKILRNNNLITGDAEIYYEQSVWDNAPAGTSTQDEKFDFSTYSSDDDDMYYRVSATHNSFGWSINISYISIPPYDPEMDWYETL